MWIYEYKAYETLEEAEKAVLENNPELLDDDIPDFLDQNIEWQEDNFDEYAHYLIESEMPED